MKRPPIDLQSLARSYTKEAVRTLVSIINDKNTPPAARVAASKALRRLWKRLLLAPSHEPIAHESRKEIIESRLIEWNGVKNGNGSAH